MIQSQIQLGLLCLAHSFNINRLVWTIITHHLREFAIYRVHLKEFIQVALITLIHSLSSNLFLVPTLSFTRLFLLLSVCGTASIVPCVLRLLLFHLNGNLLIYAPMGVMSRISSTLLLTCVPCFHANIIKINKINKIKRGGKA